MSSSWRIIFVSKKPYRIWHDESLSTSLFLDGLNYDYFSVTADTLEENLDRDGAWAIQLAIRIAYGHALEAFFALLFATLQAPFDPAAWLLLYKPGDIVDLLRRFEAQEDLPSLIIPPEPGTWEALVGLFLPLHLTGSADPERLTLQFAELWKRLAEEMLDSVGAAEYNSLKHGFRARAVSQEILIGGHQVLASEHGSWFPFLEQKNANVFVRSASRTWSPRMLCATLRLIASSIGNLLNFLRLVNASAPSPDLGLSIPTAEDFAAAEPGLNDLSSLVFGAQWVEGGKPPSPVDKADALTWYRQHAVHLRIGQRGEDDEVEEQ